MNLKDVPPLPGQTDVNEFFRDPQMCGTMLTKAAYHGGALAAIHLVSVRLMVLMAEMGAPPEMNNAVVDSAISLINEIGGPVEADFAEETKSKQ